MSQEATPGPATRRLTCARCGNAFACDLDGNCWCMAEDVRLPMPAATDGDCLCRDCLRAAAESATYQPNPVERL